MGWGSTFRKIIKVAAPVVGVALAPFTGGASLAIAGAVSAGVSGYEKDKQAKRAEADARGAQASAISIQREQIDKFDALLAKLPKQTEEFLEDITVAYTKNREMLSEAKAINDEQAIANFQAIEDIIETNMAAELSAIGESHIEYVEFLNTFSDEVVGLVRSDAEANSLLKQEFRDNSDKALKQLEDASGLVTQRMEAIEKSGGLPEGASAVISKMRQGISDVHRQVKDIDAARGKGGSASRSSAVLLEGIKNVGETMAGLKQQGTAELMQLVGTQTQIVGQQQATASGKVQLGQETSGREIADARSPFIEAQLNAEQTRDASELAVLRGANMATAGNQASLGATQLAEDQAYGANLQALESGEMAAKLGVKENQQAFALNATAQVGKQATSMSDIFTVQANNYSNQAKNLRAGASEAMSSAFSVLGAGAAGMVPGGGGFMSGVQQFAMGIPKQTPTTNVSPFVGNPNWGVSPNTDLARVGVTPFNPYYGK